MSRRKKGSRCKLVFEPIEIRGIDFKYRTVLAPPSANHTNTGRMIMHEFVDWLRQFARGMWRPRPSTSYVAAKPQGSARPRD